MLVFVSCDTFANEACVYAGRTGGVPLRSFKWLPEYEDEAIDALEAFRAAKLKA